MIVIIQANTLDIIIVNLLWGFVNRFLIVFLDISSVIIVDEIYIVIIISIKLKLSKVLIKEILASILFSNNYKFLL